MKKKHYIYAGLALIIIIGSYAWYKKSHSNTEQTRYVTAEAQKSNLITSVTASGNVIVDESATVDPTITGTVANLSVSVGDQVKKDELLFTIVNDDLETTAQKAGASYQQALDNLETAKLAKKQAEADYDAAKKKDNADGNSYTTDQLKIMEKQLSLKDNAITEAQNSVDTALATYKNARSDAAKRNVTSPIDGTVNAVNIKNGDDLSRLSSSSNSSAPIIIGDMGTLKARVEVNEVDISNIQIGQKVTLTFDALSDFTATGKVESIDSLGTVTQGVVTYNVTIAFDSIDEKIKPQMSTSAAIITDTKTDVLVVPTGAVKYNGDQAYVEVMKDGAATPESADIAVGATNGTETEVTRGLSAGEKVVTQTITSGSSTSTSSASSSSSGSRNSVRVPGLGGFGH